MIYRFLLPIVTRFIRLAARLDVGGNEHMPYGRGVLLVSNHLTNFDPLLIGICFKRELHFMAKIELYRNPALAWIITQLQAFPVHRGEADRAALRQAEHLLREGRVVAIFPEGHRSVAGTLQAGQGGIALIARRTGATILPVAITGTPQFLPPTLWRWRPWRRPVLTVTVGEPFQLPAGKGRADYDALAGLIMRRVADLLPASYRGAYAEQTAGVGTGE